MLQHPDVSAFRSSLAAGLDHFGAHRGLRQGDIHKTNRILDEWAQVLFDAQGTPVIQSKQGISSDEAEEQPAADTEIAPGEEEASMDQECAEGLPADAPEQEVEEVPADAPEQEVDEVHEDAVDVWRLLAGWEAPEEALADEVHEEEAVEQEVEQEVQQEVQQEVEQEVEEEVKEVPVIKIDDSEDDQLGDGPPGVVEAEELATKQPVQPAAPAGSDDVLESRSLGVGSFPPSAPTLPLPPQPVVQHIYITWERPSSSAEQMPSTSSSSSQQMPSSCSFRQVQPSRSPPDRSRSAPRQRLIGWCKQCKMRKAVCYKLGDWECPACGRHNYASKKSCSNRRCPAAGDTWCNACRTWRSICFKEGDWACPSCQNHNYASKEVG